MKKLVLSFIIFLLSISPAYALKIPTYDTRTETIYENHQRNQCNRYQQRRNNPYGSKPLGGYSGPLGNAGHYDRQSPYYDGDGYGAGDDVGYGF